MVLFYTTRRRPMTLKIPISAKQACNVYIEVSDSEIPGAFLTKRMDHFLAGERDDIYVMMPITGKAVFISIFESPGDKYATSENFEVGKIERMALSQNLSMIDNDMKTAEWVKFINQFAFHASTLPCYDDRYYVSEYGTYKIKFVPVILNDKGQPDPTPMRINIDTNVIEAAKSKLITMTVPGIHVIGDHEFCHKFKNEDMRNELEADLNALEIYLSLGYPRIEAKEVYYSTFYGIDSQENLQRLISIDNFIQKYDNILGGIKN